MGPFVHGEPRVQKCACGVNHATNDTQRLNMILRRCDIGPIWGPKQSHLGMRGGAKSSEDMQLSLRTLEPGHQTTYFDALKSCTLSIK